MNHDDSAMQFVCYMMLLGLLFIALLALYNWLKSNAYKVNKWLGAKDAGESQ